MSFLFMMSLKSKVPFFDSFALNWWLKTEKKTTCLVLEYLTGGELFDYIIANGKLEEREAVRLFRQIVSAMEYIHNNLIVHRGTSTFLSSF